MHTTSYKACSAKGMLRQGCTCYCTAVALLVLVFSEAVILTMVEEL